MPRLMPYRPLFLLLSLILAALACSRAETPIVPVAVQVATPLPPQATPTLAISPTPEPTLLPTETAVTGDATAEIPPTETLAALPTEVPTLEPTATLDPAAIPTEATATADSGSVFPGNASFIQNVTIDFEAGLLVGRPQDMVDNNSTTWASLRAGEALWVFKLEAPQNVAGLRLLAHPDGIEAVTLQTIEVSTDGVTWTLVYTGQGDCGVPGCDTLAVNAYTDHAFPAPAVVQYVRIKAGPAPARFAFSEILVVTVP